MIIEPHYASCPYCGEDVELQLDETGGDIQSYVEDCPVCCQAWEVNAARDSVGEWSIVLRTGDE